MKFNTEKNVVQLDGEDYDEKKNDIALRLGNGERLFVISVYQTIGAGQNLQYPIPERAENNLISINNRPSNGKKDFDAIYLDKPTFLVPMVSKEMDESEFAKYLFDIEMLQENGELSIKDSEMLIRNAFSVVGSAGANGNYKETKKLYDTSSVKLLSTIRIIQAIGRICRTNMKSKDIYVLADSNIVDCIDVSVCKGVRFNREFMALVDEIKKTGESNKVQNETFINKAELNSDRANKDIARMLQNKWTDSSIEKWKNLRRFVLKYPTITSTSSISENSEVVIKNNFYMEMPSLSTEAYYTEEGDFKNTKIYFSNCRDSKTVSGGSSNLTLLMTMNILHEAFSNNGWATAFEPGKYIMTPPVFRNIYMGALGEETGRILFNTYANIRLEEITDLDKFEKFDYYIPGTSIYVDFKNWHESTYKDMDKEIEHIVKKANECDCKCVIIANIIEKKDYVVYSKSTDGDSTKIVVIPALLSEDETGALTYNDKAWNKIRRCIREYTDQD